MDLQIVIVTVTATDCAKLLPKNQRGVYIESGQFVAAVLIPRNFDIRPPFILSEMAQKLRPTFVAVCVR